MDLKDGVPCGHPGCEKHITHSCEGCGRIGASSKLTAVRIAELEAQLAAEREANRWIPVSERLPECTLHVVACQTPFSPFVACYVPGEGTWYDDDGIELDFIPTHWRELPAPPQEAADDN